MKNSISTRLLKVLIGSAFMLASTGFMFSNPTCPRNYTGAPSASSGQIRLCTACHGDFAINIAGSSVLATGLPSGSYAPGQVYNFSIKITHPTAINTIWGFAIKAVNTTNNQVVGTFTTTNPNASVKGSIANQDLELSHSSAATSAAASTYTYQNLTWTAPAAPNANESNIRFYITSVAGDGDGSEAGDYVYTSTVNAALPALTLKITSFQVAQADNRAVVIKWQTAQEENVSGFEIQSSCNGTDWKVISTLTAKGNASVSQSYNYSDATSLINANSNTLYYRLRIVDKDGSYQYSGVKSLQLKLSPFVVQSLSPSPAQANTGLQFRIQCSSSQIIITTATDVNGKMLYSNKKDVNMGTSIISLPSYVMGATKGLVFIKFTNGNGAETTFKQIIE